jgi:hypothetical protein
VTRRPCCQGGTIVPKCLDRAVGAVPRQRWAVSSRRTRARGRDNAKRCGWTRRGAGGQLMSVGRRCRERRRMIHMSGAGLQRAARSVTGLGKDPLTRGPHKRGGATDMWTSDGVTPRVMISLITFFRPLTMHQLHWLSNF